MPSAITPHDELVVLANYRVSGRRRQSCVVIEKNLDNSLSVCTPIVQVFRHGLNECGEIVVYFAQVGADVTPQTLQIRLIVNDYGAVRQL